MTQRNSEHSVAVDAGKIGTETQWTEEDRDGEHRGTVGRQEKWTQRNSELTGTVGTVGTEEQCAQRYS